MPSHRHSKLVFLLIIIALFGVVAPASARGRFGVSLGGPIGIHASTHGGVGVSLPTPQVSAGTSGGYYDVSATADPSGVRTHADGPFGVSGDVSSDGNADVGVSEQLPAVEIYSDTNM